jgi:hypothetical protein
MATFSFRGTIISALGEPQSGKLVTAYRKTSLRDYDARQPTATSDSAGKYVIGFTWTDVDAGDFEIVATDNVLGEIGRSVVLLDLEDGEHRVDIVTGGGSSYRGRSEFRRIEVAVAPLASDGGNPIAFQDLALEDVDYLANRARYPASVIASFIHAHRLADLTANNVPADAFFAMLREGLSPVLAELLAQGPEMQRAALDRAVAQNLFDDPGPSALNNYIVVLGEMAIDSAVWLDVTSGNKSKFRRMIDSADRGGAEGAESVQRDFLAKYADHTGSLDSFWAAVIADPNLGQDVHDTYKWCFQVQAVCHGHQPLIDVLQAKRNDGQDPINSFADLATLDVEGWKTLIDSGPGVPGSFLTRLPQAYRVQRYAETIARLVSDAAPTRVVHERIKRDNLEISGADDLDTFFTNNPSFDLRNDVFQRFLDATPTALDAVPTTDGRRAACAENVKAIQRLSYVAPRGSTYDTIKPLYQAGLRSAADIDAMGPVAFVRRFAADFGDGEIGKTRARAVYDRASHVYAITLALLTKYAPAFNRISLGNALETPILPSSAPDLEALFGSMDFCGCEHCRSLFSPAAYMVDLLVFLRHQPGTTNDALTDLQARRPDITKIDLSCANANTPLPYIDLVNELLETRVSNGPAPADSYWQTTWTAEELALRPERRDDGAYLELAAAAYPWNLPFDFNRTEADLYLDELGVPRHAVLEAFNPDVEANALAQARLGLSKAMAEAITGGAGFTTLDSWKGKNAASLTSVALVLDVSRHSFAELQTILATEFVGTGLTLTLAPFPDDCNLELASIAGLTDAHLERWHRFVRLQRALGWTAYQLDAALRALAPTTNSLDTAFLQRLGSARVIGARLGLEGLDLLGLWANIDTAPPPEDPNAPSHYARMFLRRTLVDDPDATNFALDGNGELADTAEPMNHDSRLAVVMAALGASNAEVNELVDWLTDAGMVAATDTTTIAVLSAARRRISLARALGVALPALRRLVVMTGIDPFHDGASVVDMAGLQNALDFLDAAQVVRESKFSVEALDYILFHRDPKAPGLKPDPIATVALLETLDEQLAGVTERYGIVAEEEDVENPSGGRLRDALAEYLDPSDPPAPITDASRLDDLMAIIVGTSNKSDMDQNDLISNEMGGFLADVPSTQSKLVGGSQLSDRNARVGHVLGQLLPWLEARARRALTIQTLSEGLGLPIRIGEQLLVEYMKGAGAAPLVETFEVGGNIDGNGKLVAASEVAFVRLYKAGALVLGHGFDARDLIYLYGPSAPAPAPWLSVDDLAASSPTGLSFEAWARLASVARARARLPEHRDTLEVLRALGDVSEVDDVLADRGWRAADVNHVRVELGLDALADFNDEAALLTILDALELVDRTGLSASMLIDMATTEATSAHADALRHSLRARHSNASWASTGKALRDPLRERQRQALVAYLLANGDGPVSFSTENDLYAHYLLDVEMSACATTSRIRLALSSIQLFIQRVFLNLEAPIQFDADAAVQYRWMKNYRVWEANRKVFLYPENFVEPELRRDTSRLFSELEATLAQDDPSEKLTEAAYLDYLHGLETIAKPEVMGLVRERINSSGDAYIDRLHVIARTRGEPHRWLYRTREDQRFWTAWVGLDADIEGDHVLPAVFNGRLYILWPTFRLAGEEISEVDSADEGVGGKAHVEIHLNWMERRFGEWSPVRMSPSFKTPSTVAHWSLPSYQRQVRLSTRVVQSISTGRPALEVVVRRHIRTFFNPVGKLWGIGLFVLEATDDTFTAQAVAADGVISSWTLPPNGHIINGQTVVARSSDSSSELQLAVAEDRWPGGNQTQTLFADPPQRYTLMFAQTDVPGVVRSTGFFFQDRWRSLFIEPRDSYEAKQGALNMVDPGKIEAAPFMEQAGLEIELPIVDLAPKSVDLAPELLKLDNLEVKTPTYNGLAGVIDAQSISINPVADQQVVALAKQEYDDATAIHGTEPTPHAEHTTVPWMGKRFRAYLFEHPYTPLFMGEIRAGSVQGLLAPTEGQGVEGLARQQLTETVLSAERYDPKSFDSPLPTADVDFSVGGAYSIYNWELFFHAPVLLAKRLTNNQRFEEADWWLRKVFDPTASDGEVPARYWQIKPFFDSAQPPSIHELLLLLQYEGTDSEQLEARAAFEDQIWRWRRRPFDPHLIAGLRDGSYQRAVIMQYLDNLIAWGDSLFAQDTLESINEATQLYVMAQNVLGQRPRLVNPHGQAAPKNFEELESGGLDAFSNAVVELENYTLGSLAHSGFVEQDANSGLGTWANTARVPHGWYFCVPPNDKLLGYWDTVEDRLTKIRNCQNLQGIERKLALFEPPLDPGALVAAAALAGDFSSALAAVSGRAPRHRFRVLLAKSLELAGEVRNLGSTLLGVLEGRDNAKLAQLRAAQEPALLERVRASLELRLEHAERMVEALDAARVVVWDRRAHYNELIAGSPAYVGEGSVEGRSIEEQAQLSLLDEAEAEVEKAILWSRGQRHASLAPNLQLGIQGVGSSPVLTMSFGGSQLAGVMGAHASIHQQRSSKQSLEAQRSGLNASYERRLEEWKLQQESASKEIEHIEAQKAAALTQIEVAKAEIAAHDKRVKDARIIDEFMRTRYTNDQLYDWMATQIKQVYKQAYNLAFRMALAAEQAYRFELQRNDSFIGYQYWDQAHAGLLAGDLLVQDLHRMDAAYIDNYEREYELTKVLSLAQVDPYALATLRQTGSCYFTVPEWVYDLDHPGHVRRRIKSVSVAMPAVAGPHVGGGCTLTLESSRMRIVTGNAAYGTYAEDSEDHDTRFVYRYGQVERIATSSGRDSTGVFEPALEGPLYMPFEGAGAISTWRVNLPANFRQFDYESIGDVLLTIHYTAREGGSAQAQAALDSLDSISAAHTYVSQPGATGAAMMLRASVDFADAWYAFLREEHGDATRTFTMELDASRFPYAFAKRANLEITALRLVLATDAPAAMNASVSVPSGGGPVAANFATSSDLGGHMLASWTSTESPEPPGTFTLSINEQDIPVGLGVAYASTHTRFDENVVRELVVVVFFGDPS